jgi:DNA polymerase III delta prime subunit
VKAMLANDALYCVAKGTGIALEHLDTYKKEYYFQALIPSMDFLIETYKKTGDIHHAYILEGEAVQVREKLYSFIQKHLGVAIQGNPDFWYVHFDSLTIDDARKLREVQTNRPVAGDKKIFVIETRTMTLEAQNSLLKFLEEPTPQTYIFIIVPSTEVILPTLRSRAIIISFRGVAEKNHEAVLFLGLSLPDRIKKATEIAEEKDKAGALSLIDGLITEFYSKKEKRDEVLKELLMCRMYINDRSPSLKLLLEHIACVLP